MEQYRINRVWVDDTHIWAETQNGWKANYPLAGGVVLLTPHLLNVKHSY